GENSGAWATGIESCSGERPEAKGRVTMQAAATSPAQATRDGGRYELLGELAVGGMATVYLGKLRGPMGFARTVAIKCMHPPFARDPQFAEMFLDEACLSARIRHPNVVPTVDVIHEDG